MEPLAPLSQKPTPVVSPLETPALNIMPAPPTPQAVFGVGQAHPLPEMREFGDALKTRQFIYEDALKAARGLAPIEDDKHVLRLTGVDWHDKERHTRKERKKAVLTGETLARRMRGTWELYNKADGTLLDKRTQIVGAVPYLSSMGTFVHRGNEYIVNHQQRLKSGVFARVKDNGELESHFNILPGKGVSHRYFMDPENGVFKVKFGQAEMPLMPLIRAMGATDREIRDAWGDSVWQANYAKNDAGVLKKLALKLLRKKDLTDTDEGTATQKLVEKFNSMELDPSVTSRTLGKPYDRVSKEAILAATSKLLKVGRKEADPDDRDHLAYQQFLGPEDLFAERLTRDHGNLRRALLKKMIFAGGNLQKMPSGALTPQLEQVLIGSGLGQVLEEINPAEVFDKQSRITRMGEGGIPSLDSIPDEARSVQPSHMGFMDPIRTPESLRAGVDLYMARASRKGRNGQIYTQMRDRTGETVWKTPEDLAESAIATPDVLKWDTKRVPVMRGGKLDYIEKKDIDYVLPDFSAAFSPLANLVPFMSASKPGRVSMGSRYITQALPLVNAEAPAVRGGIPNHPDNLSYEEDYGKHMGAIKAKQAGRVMKIDDGVVHVKYDDGTKDEIELYQNHPFNRKSVAGSTQIYVRRGVEVFSLAIEDYNWEAGDCTLSVDPITKKSAWMEVTGYTKHKNDKKLYHVVTDSGRSVVVTEDHSLITLDSLGDLVPVYPLDCIVGKTRLPLALLPVTKDVTVNPLNEDTCKLNDDMLSGQLVGLYLSEGHCPENSGCINIAVADEKRATEVMVLIYNLGFAAYRCGSSSVCFTDHSLNYWLRSQFGHFSHNKRIPDWVLTASLDFKLGLIAGYMAGDGCLWGDSNGAIQVTAVSVSKTLRDDLVSLLATLGLFCTLFDAPRTYLNKNWRDAFGLRVINTHLHKLARWFFYADRELKFRKLLQKKYRSSPFEIVPIVDRVARKTLYRGFTKTSRYVHKTALIGGVAKHRLVENNGVFGLWGRSDVLWDIVVSILPTQNERWVYDLSVRDSECFAVCQGLVVHNTFFNQQAVVQPGDTFKPGQLLARSNYTDDKGVMALGINMRVAYMPYKGLNFEDAQVISESAAKRLSSEHMYQHDLEVSDKHKIGKNAYISLFPSRYDKKTLSKLDDQGVIQVGQTVEYGEPLVLAAKEKEYAHNKIHKQRQAGYSDDTITWKHHDTGTVTDVVWGKNGPVVLVKATSPMQVGDKMSGRFGDKGVLAAIIPDAQMPHDKDGKPFEVLLSPDGVVTRTNPSQNIEAALGKIALKTGKPVTVPDFTDIDDLSAWAEQQLKLHGIKDKEDIIWPEKNMTVKNVGTGYRFMMKLQHTAESKEQGRDSGAYSADETPAKGGETGCFVGTTQIRISKDFSAPIANIVFSKRAYVLDTVDLSVPAEPKPCREEIRDWFHYRVHKSGLVILTLENGEKISVTKSHEFVLKDGTRKVAGNLTLDDELLETTHG